MYRLTAVLVHTGAWSSAGHYFAYVLDSGMLGTSQSTQDAWRPLPQLQMRLFQVFAACMLHSKGWFALMHPATLSSMMMIVRFAMLHFRSGTNDCT